MEVDREVYDLVERSLRISSLTPGAFDITYGSIDESLWNFDKSMMSLPDERTAKQTIRLINYRNVILNNEDSTVFLKEEGMRIGFGGIGKGYAADRARNVMQKREVQVVSSMQPEILPCGETNPIENPGLWVLQIRIKKTCHLLP